MGDFKLIFSTRATGVTPVHKYRSEASGMSVVIAEIEGPVVSAFICLGTEAHDDDGLPHTLEHLVFLGSLHYPFKGLLDLMANRWLASGTNAWTDVDHTAYSLSTAGGVGALHLLPIYLDHILWPQLTDYAYITEVHHVTPQGTDAGVVYCEMQGRENSAESRCYNRLLQLAYEGSGYASETGGKLHNLRTSTSNTKVKEYHKKFYRPENVTIIVGGKVKPEEVFEALQPVEDTIKNEGPREEFVRPWQGSVPPLLKSRVERLPYPTDSEDSGLVQVGWRGPCLFTSQGLKDFTACSILLRYLCDTPVAPLQKALTEIEQPYASDVLQNLVENSTSLLLISLENVPVEKLQEALDVLLREVGRVCNGEEPLEQDRLLRLLRLQHREALSYTEASPHQTITFMCIADMLHSQDNQQMEERLNKQKVLKELESESVEWWREVCHRYLGEPHVAVLGVPSPLLMEEMAREEEERVQAQVTQLGPEGLRRCGEMLSTAMDYNGREPPTELLAGGGVSECQGIQYLPMKSWASGGESCPYFSLDQMPFYTRLHHIQSHFVYITLVADTSECNVEQRTWLPLLCEVLPESPVRRGEELLPHTVLLADMERLTNEVSLSLGIRDSARFSPGVCGQAVTLFTQCEAESYEEVVKLVWEVLHGTELTRERLMIVAQRLVQDVATIRRDGERLVHDVLCDLSYSSESNIHVCSVLRQQRFLKSVLKQLEEGGEAAEAVLQRAERARRELLAPKRLWLQLASDLTVSLSSQPWQCFATPQTSCVPICMTLDREILRGEKERQGQGSVVGVGGVESCFLEQLSPGPAQPTPASELAPLLVALQYFTQLEGPLWRQVRGAGLAYGFSIAPTPVGLLCLELYKATNPTAAYQQTISIIKTFLDSGKWEEGLFTSAKSSLVFEVVQKVHTSHRLIRWALYQHCQGLGEDYVRQMVAAVCAVTEEQALAAAQHWLGLLLKPEQATLSIVCHPSKVQEVARQFSQMGHNVKTYNSLEESHLNDD